MADCSECGHPLKLSVGPGRTRAYRGMEGFLVPAELAYEECDHCGAQWMTGEQLNVMSDALEAQRLERRQLKA